jgi:hypothetical protein
MRSAPLLAVLVILACVPAFSEEIVYLTSGSAMAVRSHVVKGDMIHLDLGGDSFIAFPMALVDRIEGAQGIQLKPSHSNVIHSPAPGAAAADYTARGLEVNRVSRERQPVESNPHIQVDPRMGIAGYVEDPSKGDRSSVSTGRREVLGLPSSDAYRGTSRLGNKFVIQGGPKPALKAQTVGVRFKGTSSYPPPPELQPSPAPSPDPTLPNPTDGGGSNRDSEPANRDSDPGD